MIDLNSLVWSEISVRSSMPEVLPVDSLEDYTERLQEWAARQPRNFEYVSSKYKNLENLTGDAPDADHPYVAYLKKLFKPDDWICIFWVHSTEEYAPGKAKVGQCMATMAEIIKADSLPTLEAMQMQGWHLFVGMNPLVAGSTNRKKDRVAEIRTVYCEADDNGLAVRDEMRKAVAAGEVPTPHFVIESSPNKFQFIWLVEGFTTTAQQEQMNSSLQVRFHTDSQSVDCVRVLRLPGFKNLKPKYGPDFPVSKIVGRKNVPRYRPEDFKIKIVDPVRDESYRPPIASEEINKILVFVTEALDEAGVMYEDIKELPSGALRIHLKECPWGDEHSDNKRGDADVFVNSDGSLGFKCFHGHCAARDWGVFREELETLAGHKLKFGESSGMFLVGESVTNEEYKMMLEAAGIHPPKTSVVEPPIETKAEEVASSPKSEPTESRKEPTYTGDKYKLEMEYLASQPPQTTVATAQPPKEHAEQVELTLPEGTPTTAAEVTDNKTPLDMSVVETIPPYSTPIRGIFAKAVDIVAGGTTMPRQFPNLIAKTFLGLRLAVGKSVFEDCPEPRLFSFLLGDSGTSKGWSIERSVELFTCFNKITIPDEEKRKIKVVSSIDSGAGLVRKFFAPPESAGVLVCVGESKNLMDKARADRNPEIMSQIIELANSKNISIVKAQEQKTKSDAHLAMVMACQPDAIDSIFAGLGTTVLGFYDRLTLEFAEPRDAGDTPNLDRTQVEKFYDLMCKLQPMKIKQGVKAKAALIEYFGSLPTGEKKARFRQNLFVDHFLIQASQMADLKGKGKTSGETSLQDALDAIANARRQAVIRRIYLTVQAGSLTAVYIARIKKLHGKQTEAIRNGRPFTDVALSERDFLTATHAYRDNDEEAFSRAWRACENYRYRVPDTEMPSQRGRKTAKYLPSFN